MTAPRINGESLFVIIVLPGQRGHGIIFTD